MILKNKILLVFILIYCIRCSAAYDVSNVSFDGDCTDVGMRIVSTCFDDNGAFSIVTTGARFVYTPGEMRIYQSLKDISERLIATLSIQFAGKFKVVEANDDHVLLWSKRLNMGIYGCSTLIIDPKTNDVGIIFRGKFAPDYVGRIETDWNGDSLWSGCGELLLIDDLGGIEIYPQRYEGQGYDVINMDVKVGKKDWKAHYLLYPGERVMIAAFPGKPFDWEESFKNRIIITHGNNTVPIESEAYGLMPSDFVIQEWSKAFDIIVLFKEGLYDYYKDGKGPSYDVENEPEFRRFVKTAHRNHMKVAVYSSFGYYYTHKGKINSFYQEIEALRKAFDIDGVYIDGLIWEHRSGIFKKDNKIANWEMIRRLRKLFGPDGVIILHGTHIIHAPGTRTFAVNPVSPAPNIDSYCTATLNGENVPFKMVDDPDIWYTVRKYGISNTIGMWVVPKSEQLPKSITHYDIIDAVIGMNGRQAAYTGKVYKCKKRECIYWGHGMGGRYCYYLKKLASKLASIPCPPCLKEFASFECPPSSFRDLGSKQCQK